MFSSSSTAHCQLKSYYKKEFAFALDYKGRKIARILYKSRNPCTYFGFTELLQTRFLHVDLLAVHPNTDACIQGCLSNEMG